MRQRGHQASLGQAWAEIDGTHQDRYNEDQNCQGGIQPVVSEATPRPNSLVLYKGRPARVQRVRKRLQIELPGGETLKVRFKDVSLLHPGPLEDLHLLQPQEGEVETAWELLAGSQTTLPELVELAYGVFDPATAWAGWQLVADGLYFSGSPDQVVAHTAEKVSVEKAERRARAADEKAWATFLGRLRDGELLPQDSQYLKEVEEVALDRRPKSRLLRELGRTESQENAHSLLLELGHWDHSVNPYPQRLRLASAPPKLTLPDLPEEPRRDLTHLPALAIDDEGNQEPDDALSLEGSRLWVHVADAAALVQPDTEVDLEARARGATLYLPEGAVPMLPWAAVGILGLGLADISPALSFGLDLNGEGQISHVEVVPSWVRVTRLTYKEAETRLREEPLEGLYRLAQILRARRQEQGAVSIELPEIKIWVEGGQVAILPVHPLRSRDLVTEAMLVAGEAAARFAADRSIPIPFTTQSPPRTDERPLDMAGMYGLRRASMPSQQSTTPGPHAGLGLENYAQATSPLRRYLDLVVHQQLRAHLRGEPPLTAQDVLGRVGATAALAGSLRRAERLARTHWTLVYLLQHPNWHGEGILVEKRGRRATVLIPSLDLDAQVHLPQDLPVNSPVKLALGEVNLAHLTAHFQIKG